MGAPPWSKCRQAGWTTDRQADRQTGAREKRAAQAAPVAQNSAGFSSSEASGIGTRSRANPPGCPELCPASANQPPGPHQCWMAPPPVFPTQALMSQLALWSDAAVLRVPQGEGVTLTAKAKKPGEDRGAALV